MMKSAVPLVALLLLPAFGEQHQASLASNGGAVAVANAVELSPAGALVASAPTDPQIAAIVLAANSVDSTAGMLAIKKAHDPRVKAFAERMVTDHSAVNRQAVALARKLGLKPEPNETSRSLRAGGRQNIQKLEKLSGAAFDRAYIDHEVALHEQVLGALNQTLIPSAKNPELKALLEKGRPIFTGHLEMAKQIQTALHGS